MEQSLPSPRNPVADLTRILLPIFILSVAIGGSVWILWAKPSTPSRPLEESKAPLVETIAVVPHTSGLQIEVDGTVVPYREVELSAEVPGQIKQKAKICRAGNYVTAGTLLLEIDPRDYDLEVRRLTKEHAQTQGNVKELNIEIESAKTLAQLAADELELERRELARIRDLVKRKVATESQFDEEKRNEVKARNALLTVNNQLRLLQTQRTRLAAAVERAAIELEKAQLDLTRTKIISPIDGVVVQDAVESGAYVQKGATLVTIEDTSAVEVKCNLRMDELFWIWQQTASVGDAQIEREAKVDYQIPRTPATVVYELGGREYTWKGVLARYDGIGLDAATHTMPCRVVVDSPRKVTVGGSSDARATASGPPALLRGMYVTVKIHATPRVELLSIPEQAVRPGGRVWCARPKKVDPAADNPGPSAGERGQEPAVLRIVTIKVIEYIDGMAIVDAGSNQLAAGDKIITSPLAVAEEGMAVREQSGQ